jgi:hypothetical protein
MKKCIFLIGLFSLSLFACQKDLPDDEEKQINEQPRNKDGGITMVIDAATVSKKLDNISSSGTMTFSNLAKEETPTVGSIICSVPSDAAPAGFFYKVKGVKIEGNKTVISTETATLEEAVKEAEVNETVELTDYIIEITDNDGNVIPLSQTKSDISSGVKFDVDKTFKLGKNEIVSGKLKGTVEFKSEFDCSISIDDWTLKKLSLTTSPEFKTKLTIGLEGTIIKDSILINITKFKTGAITVWAELVPIVITPEISIDALVTAEGKIKLQTTLVDVDYKYTYGCQYENGDFRKISKNSSEPAKYLGDQQISLSGEIKVSPQLNCNFRFYDQESCLGIYADFQTKLSVDNIKMGVDIIYGLEQFNPKMKLVCGLSLDPQAKLAFFSKQIAEWKPTFDVISWTIWERGVFPEFSDITFGNPTGMVVVGDEVISPLVVPTQCEMTKLAIFLFAVEQHGFCWGKTMFPTIEKDSKNQLGYVDFTNTIGTRPMKVNIPILELGAIYYVRSYFTNMFGTFYGKPEEVSYVYTTPGEEEIPITGDGSNPPVAGPGQSGSQTGGRN